MTRGVGPSPIQHIVRALEIQKVKKYWRNSVQIYQSYIYTYFNYTYKLKIQVFFFKFFSDTSVDFNSSLVSLLVII
jgi:hypothetical protein